MRFVIDNAFRSIFRNPKDTILILLNMIICTAVVFVFVQNYYYLNEHISDYFSNAEIAKNYKVDLSISNMHLYLDDCKNQTPMYYVGNEVYKEIEKNPNVYFYDFMDTGMPLYDFLNNDKLKDFSYFDSDYDAEVINVLQLSGRAFDALGLEVDEGRAFTDNDINNNSPDSPAGVILGSDYKGIYKIGDKIKCNDYEVYDCAEVIGFLKDDSDFKFVERSLNLDKHMIFPVAFPRHPESNIKKGVNDHQYIHTDDTDLDLQTYVNGITTKYGFYTLKLDPIDGIEISEAKDVSMKNVALIAALALIGSVICILSLTMILYNRAVRNRAKYGILMCAGIPLYKLNASISLEMLIMLLLSVFPTIGLSIYEYGEFMVPIWQLFAFTIPIMAAALIPTFAVNRRINLDMLIRNKIV